VQTSSRFGPGMRGHVELPQEVRAEELQTMVSRIPSKQYPGMDRVCTLTVHPDGRRLVPRTLEPRQGGTGPRAT
jgi:hypothetical protein